MEKNNGFNNQPEGTPKVPLENSTDKGSSKSKKDRRQDKREPEARPERTEKRRAEAEPLGKMIIGEEIVLFEQPKRPDMLSKQAEAPEAETDAEAELSDAVEAEATQLIIEDRLPEVEAEVAAATTAEDESVAIADEQFLEAAQRRIEADPSVPVSEVLDEAYRETVAQINDQPAETVDVPTMPSVESAPIFVATEADPSDAPDASEAQPSAPDPETARTPLTPLEAARQAAAEAHGDTPPEPPRGSDFWLDQPSQPAASSQSFEGAVSPSVGTETATTTRETVVTKSSWGALLVGYVIGRRGGRKRAEKRFKPVQQKLNETITNLKAAVSGREAQIRDISREQARQHVTAEERSREVPTMPLPPRSVEQAPAVIPVPRQESQPMAPSRPEAIPATPAPEKAPPVLAEQLAKVQLLQVAEQIRVDGISVRSMHEVGRFDENSLRRIVHEYLGGNRNIASVVTEEVEKHDRTRFARFETLNQAAPATLAGLATAQSTTPPTGPQHGSLPRPVDPATQQAAAVNPSTGRPEKPEQPIGTAEKVVLGTSVVFIILAAVIIGVVLSRS